MPANQFNRPFGNMNLPPAALSPFAPYLPNADPNYQFHPGSAPGAGDYAQALARVASGQDPRMAWADYHKAHGSGGGPGLFGRIGNSVGNVAGGTWQGFTNRNARTNIWPIAAAGIFGGLAGGGAAAPAGNMGGPLGNLAPVAGTSGGVGFGSLAGPAAGVAGAGTAGIPTGYYTPAGSWVGGTSPGNFGAAGGFGPAALGAGSVAGGGLTTGLGGAGGSGAPGFWGGTTGQTIINSGLNVFSGLLQNLAIQKAQGASQAAIDARIKQALATLSPEHIMALAQQFLPQMAANANVAGQTAIQAVREQAARTGQLEGPRALSFEAGTRAKLASDVQQRAFEAAMNTAGGQASAITGAPYTPIQPQMGIAEAIANSVNQAYQARFYQQANQQNQGTPWRYPYNPYTGQPNTGWGG